jgi:hypothetical protein
MIRRGSGSRSSIREKIDTIEGDLRPDRKPVPGYVPPPKDSGKTRPDVVIGSARG